MKKAIFFLFLLFLPSIVSASSYLTSFEVLNGTLSIPFTEKNNIYTVYLNDAASSLEYEYTLDNPESEVEIIGNEYNQNEENVMILKVKEKETSETETYTFYLEKEETSTVGMSLNDNTALETTKEIPHLKEIVIGICSILILLLFKLLIINFWKKNKKHSKSSA